MSEKELLIIEDDPKARRAIRNAFLGASYRGPSYKFLEAGSIREGLRVLNENPHIEVVLLDLKLPDGSGKDFLEQIKDQVGRYRIIILTAHEEHLSSANAMAFSVFNYLPKATRAFTQSIRFSVDQAFKDIEREQLKDKNKILIEIQTKINSNIQESTSEEKTLDALKEILSSVCQSVRSLFGAYTCHIRVYDLKKGEFELLAFDGPDDAVRAIFDVPRRKDEMFGGLVARTKSPMLFRGFQTDEGFADFREQSLKRIASLESELLLKQAQEYFDAIQSAFIAPITTRIFDDETDAIFNVSGDSIDFFSEEKQEVLKEFVTQVTIAITKAWQKKRKAEAHKDYRGISTVLEEISKGLRGEVDKNRIYEIAISGISDIIKPETVSIFLYNAAKDCLDNEAEFRGGKRFEPRKKGHPTDAGLTGWVFTHRQPLRLPNLQKGDRDRPQKFYRYSKDLETDYVGGIPSSRVEHYLGVPMIIGDEVIGAIQLLNKRSDYYLSTEVDKKRWLLERGFSEDCENVLGIAAGYLAVAIKNANLFEEGRKQISQLAILKDVGRFTSSETLGELLGKIIHQAAEYAQAELCLLFLLDDSKTKVVLQQRYGISEDDLPEAHYGIGDGLTGEVVRTGRSVLQAEEVESGKYDREIERHLKIVYGEDKRIESLMIVAIKARDDILGVIKVINKKGLDQHYNNADLKFFEDFASYVGIAIENAQRSESAVRELATAESNSTLSNLVASVAHEINNTYGLIPDSVAELRDALPETIDLESELLLREIEELAMQMVYYSNEIGGYSIGRLGEHALLNINDVVIAALYQIPEFRKPKNFANISIVTSVAETALLCWVHENPLIRTIRNVMINAYQAFEGKAGGEIVIATREDADACMALIEISDNGCGIKPEYAERIFDPEFTSKPGKGSGIGLWLAKRHLDSIGGTIEFVSTVGEGTTFFIGIPLVERTLSQDTK